MNMTDNEDSLIVSNEKDETNATVNDEKSEEMIPKSEIDAYIKDQVAVLYNDTVAKAKMEDDARMMAEADAKKVHVDLKKQSPEPWIEVVSENINADGKIEIQMDWNDAFIAELRKNKYEGITEEELVQKYMLLVMTSVVEDMA